MWVFRGVQLLMPAEAEDEGIALAEVARRHDVHTLQPILHAQPRHAGELAHVGRDERQVEGHR
ncbi:hypothetical protein, partial [Acuticoccus sediminis]|uniref:hypothetical protein n=1 Tax=Acuticoccus sediminis TaxID=2184697 RepID=UPI001B3B7D30